jgi:hypothetical protein
MPDTGGISDSLIYTFSMTGKKWATIEKVQGLVPAQRHMFAMLATGRGFLVVGGITGGFGTGGSFPGIYVHTYVHTYINSNTLR